MRYTLCLLFYFVLFPYTYSQNTTDDWHLFKSENGVSLYSRKETKTGIKELRSVMTIKTSLAGIIALLYDWDSYPKWNYRCEESKTLKIISETELIHYQSVNAPWPVQDQDFIINVKISQDEKTKVVTIKSTNNANYIPPFPNRTRIRELDAKWTLTPLKDGTVQLVYDFYVNPGSYVPVWLLNTAITSGPYETMLSLKEWLAKGKYQKAKNSFIKELSTP